MELSSNEFHAQAFNIINTSVNGAKELGLDISTMPPCLAVVTSTPTFCDLGHNALLVSNTMPEILQNIDPENWSWIARSQMDGYKDSVGFVFWCIVTKYDEDFVFGLSYQKGGWYSGFLSDLEFLDVQKVNPFEVVPFLEDEYEIEVMVH